MGKQSAALAGPHSYVVRIEKPRYWVMNTTSGNFTPPASSKGIPKLYTYSKEGSLHYVGITTVRLSNRLRYGLTADGTTGYHGYKLQDGEYRLDVWQGSGDVDREALECVEAEVAFLWRQLEGNWPEAQNEIHFHATNEWQRQQAQRIVEAVRGIS